MTLYGAIEAGGTKFVLAVGNEKFEIVERQEIPTQTPEITMRKTIAFFQNHPVRALGLGTFGPVDLDEQSKTYGWITNTPKTSWKMFDILGTLKANLKVPIAITTDVNVAAYGEYKFGLARELHSCAYMTVGTGIGAGIINQGKFIHGLSHPEFGHILIRRAPLDHFSGVCPFHKDCLEGMASGTALQERTGLAGKDVKPDDVNIDYIANYLGQACLSLSLSLDSEVIVLGGGVMKMPSLLSRVRQEFERLNHGYKRVPPLQKYIQLASLNDNQGIIGCLALAIERDQQ